MLFNANAAELWRRFTTYLPRRLAALAGITVTEFRSQAQVRYVKVAEYQARGVVHFHAVIRLDASDSLDDVYRPPPARYTPGMLADAIGHAAAPYTWSPATARPIGTLACCASAARWTPGRSTGWLHRPDRAQPHRADGGYAYEPPKSDAGQRTVSFPNLIASDLIWHLARFTGPEDDALMFTSPARTPLRRGNFRHRVWIKALMYRLVGLKCRDRRRPVAGAQRQGAGRRRASSSRTSRA